jgi:crotonobetainyl-CoA:carnitine CoA-transferase CaiB-like acyl-CoA transferase
MRQFNPTAKGPLDGLVVLDFSRLVAGNMLSLQLADFGAEVIKIEDPKEGDPLRAWRVKGVSAFFKVYCRNKKGITLNLRSEEGRKLAFDLAKRADVLIENGRPGTMERLGLGPEALMAANDKLIMVRVTGWGQSGPYRDKPGFGSLVEGMSGFAAMNGYADRPPVLPPLALADMVSGLYGMSGVLMALRHREVKGGKGQVIDLPLFDPIVSILGPEAAIYKLTGEIKPRTGSRSATTSPRNVFRTKDDRWIAISASMQVMVTRLFKAIGRADMLEDPRFKTNADRVKNADACEQPVIDFIRARNLDENLAFFEKEEITAAPVYEQDQLVADPHVQARGIIDELPDDQMGAIPMHAVIPRLQATPGDYYRPAPTMGEHNAEIYGRLGLDATALDGLKQRGVI